MIWHSTPVSEVAEKMNSDLSKGLNDFQVSEKLKKYGPNKLASPKKRSFFQRFLKQLKDVMVVILIIAAVVSFIVGCIPAADENASPHSGNWITSIIIIAIVLLNALFGVMRERRAEKALDGLKDLAPPVTKVIRNGQTLSIKAVDVVPGDIMVLEAGDYIPADGRIITASEVRCEESPLTGESVPVEKFADDNLLGLTPLGDRTNMVFAGCSVLQGSCTAIVTDTGMYTETGKMAKVFESTASVETPLKTRLANLGKTIAVFVVAVCIFVFIYGMIFGEGTVIDRFSSMFMIAVSLAVAAIPEGLAAIVTTVLAFNVRRMYKKHAVMRSLSAAENLGNATVICTDKTGTLTENKMKAVSLFDGTNLVNFDQNITQEQKRILMMAAMCCDGNVRMVNGKQIREGDRTESGLVSAAVNYVGMTKNEIDSMYPRLCEIPFDSERKLKTTVNLIEGKPVAIVRGAPDILLSKCSDDDIKVFKETADKMGSMALRVIGVAYKELDFEPADPTPDELENNLIFCGLIGLMDPPRQDAIDSVRLCEKAGIKVVMLTGDHITTAVSVAKQIGIMNNDERAVTGGELDEMTDEQLENEIENITVYARVSPAQKTRIINAWQSKGHVVAMTGGGINDAPALRTADVGCAMGSGSEIAKSAADMTVDDDRFSTIVGAVETGRGIFDSIRKAVQYLLACSIGEVIAVLITMLIWKVSSLSAVQLIFLNFVTAGFPALAIGMGRPNRELMNNPPRKRTDGIFSTGWFYAISLQGVLFGLLAMISFIIGYSTSPAVGCTMAFCTLAFSQLVQSFGSSSRCSVFSVKKYHLNWWLVGSIIVSIVLVLIITLSPALRSAFNLEQLTRSQWNLVVLLSLIPFVLTEVAKLFMYMYEKSTGKYVLK